MNAVVQLCLILMGRGTEDQAVLISFIAVIYCTLSWMLLSARTYPCLYFSQYRSVSCISILMKAHVAALAPSFLYTSTTTLSQALCLEAVEMEKTQSLPLGSSQTSTPWLV